MQSVLMLFTTTIKKKKKTAAAKNEMCCFLFPDDFQSAKTGVCMCANVSVCVCVCGHTSVVFARGCGSRSRQHWGGSLRSLTSLEGGVELISSRPPIHPPPRPPQCRSAGAGHDKGPVSQRYCREWGREGVFELTLAICSRLGKLQMKPSVRRNKRAD